MEEREQFIADKSGHLAGRGHRDRVALLTWQADTFAYAEGHDGKAGRYQALRGGEQVMISADSTGVLVKPDVARRQLVAEAPVRGSGPKEAPGPVGDPGQKPPPPSKPELRLRRFHGTVFWTLSESAATRVVSRTK